MTRTRFLHQRPGSQNWYARMMVPPSARAVIGKREFIQSLGTPSRREAETKVHGVVAGWKEQLRACTLPAACIENSRTPALPYVPSKSEMEEAAVIIGYETASTRLPDLIAAKAQLGVVAFQNLAVEFERRHAESMRNLFAGDNRYWHDRARRHALKQGWILSEDSPEFKAFVEDLARCGTDLFSKAKAAVEGAGHVFVPSERTQELIRRKAESAKAGQDLLSLYDQYAAQRLAEGKKRKDTLAQDRVSVMQFAEFVGKSRSLKSIKPDDVREWRNSIAALPPAYRKQKTYVGMTIREAANYARQKGIKPISLITVNKHLSALSALFTWAKRDGHADSNPCDGLFYDVVKGKNPRPPFDATQLNVILRSPLFAGCQGESSEHLSGGTHIRDWRFWIPLICLFTGARIGEVAQLNVTDLEEESGRWLLHIRNSDKTAQTTKSGQSRVVPIHSKLQAIGLMGFVQKQQVRARLDKNPRLFPELTLNDRGQNGRASRFWRTYLQRIGLKQSGDGLGAHSFRHGLADQLRLAGIYDHDIAIVLGHKQSTVTSGYGRLRQGTTARLIEMIEAAKFKGVDFSQLLAKADEIA